MSETNNPENENNFEQHTTSAATNDLLDANKIKDFYTGSLPSLLKQVFTRPIDGVRELFESDDEESSMFQGSILLGTCLIIALIIPPLLLKAPFKEAFKLTIGLGIVFVALSGASFGVKAALGQKADFKEDMLVAGLCSIPMSLFILLIAIVSLFDPMVILKATNPIAAGWFFAIFSAICFAFCINVISLSLKAGKVHDALAFYLSPTILILIPYLVMTILGRIFG